MPAASRDRLPMASKLSSVPPVSKYAGPLKLPQPPVSKYAGPPKLPQRPFDEDTSVEEYEALRRELEALRRATRSSSSSVSWDEVNRQAQVRCDATDAEENRVEAEDTVPRCTVTRLCQPREEDDEERTRLRLRTQCLIAQSTLSKLNAADSSGKVELENRLQELQRGRKRTIEKLESLEAKRTVASKMWGWKQCDVVDLTADDELSVEVW